eukprot:SAG11_NODE_2477_length_3313_cov_2.275980_5_plen_174_part_00
MARTTRLGTPCAPPPPPCPPPRSGRQPPATALQAKKPIYVVLRMDDIQVGYCNGRNTELSMIQWALDRNVKLNLGMILGGEPGQEEYQEWPTHCSARPNGTAGCNKAKATDECCDAGGCKGCKQSGGDKCNDCTVAAVNAAYHAGRVRGQGSNDNSVLELFNHAYNHGECNSP